MRSINNKVDADSCFKQAIEMQQLGKLQEAEKLYRKIITLRPTVAVYNNLACVLSDQERYGEAEALFRQILAERPRYFQLWYNLVGCLRYASLDHPDLQTIKLCLDNKSCTPEQRMYLLFALGKIYDDCDLYEDAFAAADQANKIKSHEVEFNPAMLQPIVDGFLHTFTKDFFNSRRVNGSASTAPLFIIGLPRSGKSLLEKLLAMHPAIHGAGEVPTMEQIKSDIDGYPYAVNRLGQKDADAMIELYLRELEKRTSADAAHVINTMPGNYRHLGLIWMLFPHSRIIHCVRDPMDTGLFTYFRCFQSHNISAYNLEHIGVFYRAYCQLMQHWRETLPMPVHEVSYETLIKNPVQTLSNTYRFLDMQMPETLKSDLNLHDREIGRWRCYAQQLDPLVRSLKHDNA